jgi:hypothetical protein
MSVIVTKEWVDLRLSEDPERPLQARFVSATDEGLPSETIVLLTRQQALYFHRNLGFLLASSMSCEPLIGGRVT